jgi:protein-arginine kinase activator protein McsA
MAKKTKRIILGHNTWDSEKIARKVVNSQKELKTCPHCGRKFKETEDPDKNFCCMACLFGY